MRLERSGAQIRLLDSAGSIVASGSVDGVTDVVIEGTAVDDTLVVDFSNGNPVPSGGLVFDGGAQRTAEGDVLLIAGGPFQRVVSHCDNAHDGSIELDGAVIRYTGLEPVNLGGPVASLTLDLSGLSDFGILEPTANPGEAQLRTTTFTAETQIFKVPTNTLTVRLGGNDDTLQVSPGFSGSTLILDGQLGTDTIVFTGLTLNSPAGSALDVTAETIDINGNMNIDGAQTYNNPVFVSVTPVSIQSSGGGNITFASDLSGSQPVTFSTAGNVNLSGLVSGAIGFVKNGTGDMTVFSSNTYSGGTQVNAGTLRVNNPVGGSGTGTGAVTVAANATVGGTGTIIGLLTLQSGGIVAPGNSIGNLTAGSVIWEGSAGSATAAFELSNIDNTSDRLTAVSLQKGAGPVFQFDFQNTGMLGSTYTLMSYGSTTFTPADFSYVNLPPGMSGTFSMPPGQLQFTVVPSPATHFSVSAPASATAGSPFTFTVTALDAANLPVPGYTGTVQFTSSDGAAALPANSVLVAGTGTFSATLETAGNQTITATDFADSSITGTSNAIAVGAAAATHFIVSAPASATAGSAFSFTATAQDQFNNTATTYAGTVHFTSSDGAAVLPSDSVLSGGVGTFSATLNTAGSETITATDTTTTSITGTSNAITVISGVATHFIVSTPASATAGTAFSITITALDAANNTVTAYAGTVHFTSSDGAAVLPADSTLTNGTGTFSVNLGTAGTQTVTATDTVTASITGTSGAIVTAAAVAAVPALSALGLFMLAVTVGLTALVALRR